MRRYLLTYKIDHHEPPIARSEIPPGEGATDSVVIVSMLHLEDGGLDMHVVSRDGRKPDGDQSQLDPRDRFKAWLLWAQGLMNDSELDAGRRAMAQAAFELCMNTFKRGPTSPDTN